MYSAISFLFVFAFGLTSLASGNVLNFANGQRQAHLFWKSGPSTEAESIMGLAWTDATGKNSVQAPGQMKVSLYMCMGEGMCHGSSPTSIYEVVDSNGKPRAGLFEVRDMYFTMTGAWDVKVTVRYANGSSETQVLPIVVKK